MAKKIKLFFSQEENISRVIFSVILLSAFAFVFGPSIFAQFMRMTGSSGWGYGYGYGYAYGMGYDYGQTGYIEQYSLRPDRDGYGYGYGYGFRATEETVTVGGETFQNVTPDTFGDAASGLFTPNDASNPTGYTANTGVNMTVAGAQILIPEGTVITESGGGVFDASTITSADLNSQFAAFSTALTEGGNDASVLGAISFGLIGNTLHFSQPLTIIIPVPASDGLELDVKRSPDGGTTWTSVGLTANNTDTCTDGVGSNPVAKAMVAGRKITVYTCSASDFATYSVDTGTSGGSTSGGSSIGGTIIGSSCTNVEFGNWQTCLNGWQYRDIITKTPSGCSMTTDQEAAKKRACDETATVDTVGDEVSESDKQVSQINNEATVVAGGNVALLLSNAEANRNMVQEKEGYDKYTAKLMEGVSGMSEASLNNLTNFIVYGTQSTHRLGAGERAGVINSYKAAFGKLPKLEIEWQDVIKIANGRWPGEVSTAAEAKATETFKKIYLRAPDMKNQNDNAAVTVMTYGLRPGNRNMNSEKAAINIFKGIFKYAPLSATDWDAVRAIAYSGAKR